MDNQIDYLPEKIRAIVIGVGQVGKALVPTIGPTPQTGLYQNYPLDKLETYPYHPGIGDKLTDQAMVFLLGSIDHPDFKAARNLILDHKPFFLWSIGIASQGLERNNLFQIGKREGLLISRARDSLTLLQAIYHGHSGGIIGYDLTNTIEACGGHQLAYAWLETDLRNFKPVFKKLLEDNNQGLQQARGVILMVQLKSRALGFRELDFLSKHLQPSVRKKSYWTAVDEVPGLLRDLGVLILIC